MVIWIWLRLWLIRWRLRVRLWRVGSWRWLSGSGRRLPRLLAGRRSGSRLRFRLNGSTTAAPSATSRGLAAPSVDSFALAQRQPDAAWSDQNEQLIVGERIRSAAKEIADGGKLS